MAWFKRSAKARPPQAPIAVVWGMKILFLHRRRCYFGHLFVGALVEMITGRNIWR